MGKANHLGLFPEASDGPEWQEQPIRAVRGQGELQGVTHLPSLVETCFLKPEILGMANHLGQFSEVSEQVRPHQNRLDHIRTGQTTSEQVRTGQTMSEQLRPHQTSSNHIRPAQIISDHVKTDQNRSDHIRSALM